MNKKILTIGALAVAGLGGATIAGFWPNFSAATCPTHADLDRGIVITDPARKGELYIRHRKLDGPYVGHSFVNGIAANGTSVSYAGLFTHKYWSNDKIVQYEEPQVDLTALLQFEAGTTHAFESTRYNPQAPERKWTITAQYQIQPAVDFQIGDCGYKAVRILRDGTLTMPDGKTKKITEDFVLVPDLLLRVSGSGLYFGDVSNVRNRTALDGRIWPFSADPASVLQTPIVSSAGDF